MNLTGIFSAWNLSKELPKWLAVGLLCVLCFLFGQCNSGKKTQVTYLTEYHDSTVTINDSVIIIRYKPAYVDRFHTVVVDANHDCIDSGVVLSFGLDTVSFASVNSCKGEYVGATLSKGEFVHELEEPMITTDSGSESQQIVNTATERPFLGYEFEGLISTCLPGDAMIGLTGRAWLSRFGIFATARGVVPDLSRSSLDIGVSYRF